MPIILSTAQANEPGAPAIWAQCPNNEPVYGSKGNKDAAEKVFASAPHVVRDRFVVNRVAAMTMETRAVNAEYDAGRDHYTIYACLQRPYVWRTMMAKFVFNDMAEHHMTLIAGDVGGSYGMKGGLYPEVPVVAWASQKVGRPVKWTCERSEALIADDQGRDMVIDAGLAFDNDGKFLGVTFSSRNNVGAYLSMLGFLSTLNIINDVCGAYTIPAVFAEGAAVMTNTLPVSNYRAPGGAPSAYVIERLVDMAARELGMDPAEIRRRNLVPREAMPYKTATGHVYDCGDFPAVLEKCLAKADYAGVKARKATSKRAWPAARRRHFLQRRSIRRPLARGGRTALRSQRRRHDPRGLDGGRPEPRDDLHADRLRPAGHRRREHPRHRGQYGEAVVGHGHGRCAHGHHRRLRCLQGRGQDHREGQAHRRPCA